MTQRVTLAVYILGLVLLVAWFFVQYGQAGDESVMDDAELTLAGKGYFYRAWGESGYACIYCHANFDESKLDDGYRRPGHMLWNAYKRPSFYNEAYKGGDETSLARAANTCIVAFLQEKAQMLSDQPLQALIAYLKSISVEEASPPVKITRVDTPPDMEGEPRRGEKLFAAACVLCHRERGVVPELNFYADSALVLAKIRGIKRPEDARGELAGKYAPMPFFSAERLSDQEVADILAYWEYQQLVQAREQQTEPLEDTLEMPAAPPPEALPDEPEAPKDTEPGDGPTS